MKCNDVYFYGRGGEKQPHVVAAALEEISIGRKLEGKYQTSDLASLIYDLLDRIEVLERKVAE